MGVRYAVLQTKYTYTKLNRLSGTLFNGRVAGINYGAYYALKGHIA
jgi:hypothetical protein